MFFKVKKRMRRTKTRRRNFRHSLNVSSTTVFESNCHARNFLAHRVKGSNLYLVFSFIQVSSWLKCTVNTVQPTKILFEIWTRNIVIPPNRMSYCWSVTFCIVCWRRKSYDHVINWAFIECMCFISCHSVINVIFICRRKTPSLCLAPTLYLLRNRLNLISRLTQDSNIAQSTIKWLENGLTIHFFTLALQ